MTRSDVTLCSWNSPAPLVGITGCYLSRSVSAKQSGWLQNLWTDAGTCVHCTNTCLRYQPLLPATRCATSLTHGQAYHKMSSTKQLVNGGSGFVQTWGKGTSLWTIAKMHNRLFSDTPTVYRGKHLVLHHFRRSYLKANKVRKSEGTRTVKYGYHFWRCAGAADQKLSKLVHVCRSYSLPKLVHFLTQCSMWDARVMIASTQDVSRDQPNSRE